MFSCRNVPLLFWILQCSYTERYFGIRKWIKSFLLSSWQTCSTVVSMQIMSVFMCYLLYTVMETWFFLFSVAVGNVMLSTDCGIKIIHTSFNRVEWYFDEICLRISINSSSQNDVCNAGYTGERLPCMSHMFLKIIQVDFGLIYWMSCHWMDYDKISA